MGLARPVFYGVCDYVVVFPSRVFDRRNDYKVMSAQEQLHQICETLRKHVEECQGCTGMYCWAKQHGNHGLYISFTESTDRDLPRFCLVGKAILFDIFNL